MPKGRIREKLRRSSLYTFSCYRPHHSAETGDPHHIQGAAREVFCNQPHLHKKKPLEYCSNYTSTTKYNIVTFLPKALLEQFIRVANMYFLGAALLSLTDLSPLSPESMIAPLVFVVGVSMAKEGLEDWHRFIQDMKVNLRKALVHKAGGIFRQKPWMKICVGHIVKVKKDQFFPADLLLLSSSYEDGICYVETMNLDGETNLKVKRALDVTLQWNNDASFKDFKASIKCEDPNPNLYGFMGNLKYDHQLFPLDPNQILLRGSKLRNTSYVFTGPDSKVMQNSTESPSKRSKVDKQLDKIIYLLFALLVLISLISSIGYAMKTKYVFPNWWYIRAPPGVRTDNPKKPHISGFNHLITALILYGYVIPISLYISIEMVKFFQAIFINQDIHMYDEESGTPAQARTSNINEELGQVDTILSDKTGTLTCNKMDFLKCSIAGVAYGTRASDIELAATKQMAAELEAKDPDNMNRFVNGTLSPITIGHGKGPEIELEIVLTIRDGNFQNGEIKGFGFVDSRIMNGNWMNEPNADIILLYFRILSICHTAIPDLNEETGNLIYEAESPDEGAFLVAAREFGFEFCKRSQSSIVVSERYPSYKEPVERNYKVLGLLDFTSKRKRMSVIIQDENDQIFLLCKGADSIIFDRLSKNGRMFEEATSKHLNDYGETGLRTLALAYRKIDEKEYSTWNKEFIKAKTSFGVERETMLERVSDMIEKELILVGATAVEDKLQKGVPQCIDNLAKAGLNIWVLTGDKMETTINIGFACHLLRQGMQQICIKTLPEPSTHYTKTAIKDDILMQINNASKMIKLEKIPHAAFSLIIDGKALAYALENDMKFHFLNLAIECASVICCRVSPRQKALVTRLVKEGTGKITLAIGDGANDVGMIQEADIGVGISGAEGMQAVMASDFSIAQFRFLERLLVVHGHWCYKRIAQMICYFIYKNLVFGLTLFYFEAYAGFSGQAIYDDWYMIIFNVAVTSLPVIALGVLEQDVSSDVCLQFPALYHQGPQNLYFDWSRIFGWMGNAIYTSLVIFFLNVFIFNDQAFNVQGQTTDLTTLGTIMFSCIVWVVNYQMALTMSYLTFVQHILIWGSIVLWYVLLTIYGMWPSYSTGTYREFTEVLAPTPSYWVATLLVIVACTLPYLAYVCVQRVFHPMDHDVIEEIKYYRKDIEDKHMWKREKSKARKDTKIGFTARVDAKIRQLKGKLQKTYSTLKHHSVK